MFIEKTARAYGLRVDKSIDERLNPELLTDAAARMLEALYLRFGDWQLAMFAYNSGDQQLQKAIDQVHSRNAWDLVRAGYENDKYYLARVMAAIMIMQNPEMVN